MKRSLWGWMLLCILSASLAFAQIATTSLTGTIKDPSGALVPGAKVTITNTSRGSVLTVTANSAGQYSFPQITPAKYTIQVTAAGFGDQTKSAELLVNQPATVNFTLSVQASSETVDVSAEAQTLNTSDASLGSAADNAEIQALPSETRNVPDLLALQPGVFYLPPQQGGGGDSRNGSVNGGRSDQSNVTMDGIDDNDQVNGFAFTGVLRETQDSVEEFRVATGGDNADQGRSSGAQVSMVTKSGTNKFHGAAYEYYRWPRVAANDWFVKQGQLNSGLPNTPPKILRNIFGGDLGGPIKKDKLFFFANYEGERQAEDQAVTRTVPTATYKAGQLLYPDANFNTVTIAQSQFAQLDAGCQICNTAAYPFGPGDNPNALGFFNSMPTANGLAAGDGYNTGSYTFASPAPIHLNTTIARLDYIPSDSHRIFVRGNLQDDTTDAIEQFPGQPPSSITAGDSKGIVAGDTWTLNPRMVNDLRYGYIRQGYANTGIGTGDYVDFRFLSTPTAETRSRIVSIPVNNIVDNFSWVKGNHNLEFGVNWRLIHQNNATDANSYNGASTNPYWLGGNPPQPANIGMADVNGGFGNSYEIAFANLVGTVPSLTNALNYKLSSATSGTQLADGAFVDRHFKANEFEGYAQDAWRIKPNVTLTLGLRYTFLQTPYETSGQQVTPTVDTHAWYLNREKAALAGQISEPDLQFAPAGPYYGKPGFWSPQKGNFAPRVAIAWAPNGRTSVRAGAGIYYDHFGEALVNTFDQEGSFGLSSSVTNPAGNFGIEGNANHPPSPRELSRSTLPSIGGCAAGGPITYPFTPNNTPCTAFAITWGLDSKMQTPYSETMDFSVQRELGAGFTLEMAYVGRLGRHLLNQLDLAEPVDYVDPAGGGDYYSAATQLSKQVDANDDNDGLYNGTPNSPAVPAIPYFEHVFPFMAGYDYPGESATQAIYNNEWAPYREQYGATTSLSDIDFFCYYGCPAGWQSHFWQNQFSSLYALSSMGMSYYNAGQFSIHHPASHGLTFDMNLTWAHSIDWGSDTERSNEFGGNSSNTGSFSEITNTWKPYLSKGDSDFDTRVFVTGDWVYILPVGRGKSFGNTSNGLMDAIIGGWQWSGINRWSTGLPFSLFEPGWSTDWQIESYGVQTGPIPTKKHYDQNGNPQYFANPNLINSQVYCGGCGGGNERLPYPGEAGQRNNFRGDGVFDIDSGLSKTWKVREAGSVKFDWEVYNVSNSVRFDPASINNGLTGGSLGVATSTLSTPRRMQFALRYDF